MTGLLILFRVASRGALLVRAGRFLMFGFHSDSARSAVVSLRGVL